ncbi:MAG: hypothetical protein QNJ18_13950 [Xenococcaceae cyanobacterium MO_167.B52]|nr:hypothetical protein [Xenococcaceae cyanobacterium MO_167.B52]
MIISDLNYLETVSEAPRVVGGYESIFYQDILELLETSPTFQGDVAQTQTQFTQLTDETGKVEGEAIAVSGRTSKNSLFAFASATTTSSSLIKSQAYPATSFRF